MVLRMLPEVIAIIVSSHVLKRKPAIFRFAQMSDNRDLPFGEHFKDRIKLRIIDHDQLVVFIAIAHADVFPDFHGNCAIIKTGVQPRHISLLPIGFIPAFHRKGSSALNRRGFIFLLNGAKPELSSYFRHFVVCVQCHRNNFKIVFGRLLHKITVIVKNMNMNIGFPDVWEIGFRIKFLLSVR
jgi:hypothetical protein